MLTGPELGAAIEAARIAKGVSKKKLADDFQVKPPSVQGWVKNGRIDKSKLMDLIAYFSDVVSPEHWGLRSGFSFENLSEDALEEDLLEVGATEFEGLVGQLKEAKDRASPRSQAVISRMIGLAERGEIDDRAWTLINDLLTELSRK
ncbi:MULTISPECIES: hypothetical protein [Pseudomonas]|uniref:hypothetical protein n=1 Tax=Pseudomonas TaxID=286 RepID=UPI0022496D1B|nr:hypothetical protein [Pseudomonas sp. DCB_BG]MCX2706084.1 hypothetical protein [Pseudomonas sp. DCB_BG]